MSKRETRFFPIHEVRAKRDGKLTIGGYAAVFNTWSQDLGGMKEQIRPGSFSQSIQENDIRALWSHDTRTVLGRNKASTLKLSEDAVGLAFELDLPDTSAGRDAFALIERGDVTGVSFGFMVRGEEWEFPAQGPALRTLTNIDLYEISPTAFPASESTAVAVRDVVEAARAKTVALLPDDSQEVRAEKVRLLEKYGLDFYLK